MQLWLKSILILITVGYVKAQHFIHFVILGAFGLIGLWLLSALVKDVDKLFNKPTAAVLTKPKFFLFKRSINNDSFRSSNSTYQGPNPIDLNIDWERILTNDPLSCVRSFVCQIAVKDVQMLSNTERIILRLIESAKKDSWASNQLNRAVNYGKMTHKIQECRHYYSYCPYSINTMISVMNFFKST